MRTLHLAPVVVPLCGPPVRDGAVLVDGERIVAVGSRIDVSNGANGARTRSWDGVLIPGLVNAHAHLQYTDFADLAALGRDEGFFPWLRALTARRQTLTEVQWRESARRGIHQLLVTGTTCVADIATDYAVVAPTARSGLAGISYLEVVGADTERWPPVRARLVAGLDAAGPGRQVGISPHAVYSLGSDVLRETAALARTRGLRLHPHAAESRHEDEFVRVGEGAFADFNRRIGLTSELLDGGRAHSPVAELDGLGLLGGDVHVAHGVHVDAADRALLRQRGTAVALCPRSNALLGNGEPPVAAYLAEGSPIAVGTDSLASTPSLDLMADVATLREIGVRQGAPEAGLSERLVRAATEGGAAAMGLTDVGRLAPGARADLAVFDVPRGRDIYDDLVAYGVGRCIGTVLGGRVVHRSRAAA